MSSEEKVRVRSRVEVLRMPINGGSIERLFDLFDLAENSCVNEKVRETVLTLGCCFPSGTEEDLLGVPLGYIEEICSLAGFTEHESTEFVDLCREAEGLDANQASHLIGLLEKQNTKRGRVTETAAKHCRYGRSGNTRL